MLLITQKMNPQLQHFQPNLIEQFTLETLKAEKGKNSFQNSQTFTTI